MVDDIELAQFIFLLSNHKKLRNTINAINEKGILLLGRFKDGGLQQLNSIAEMFRSKSYLPIIFDFERPDANNLTETVLTLAGLSKFIVADLTGGSVPMELTKIVENIKRPILTFINDKDKSKLFGMFGDIFENENVDLIKIKSSSNVITEIEDKIPQMEKAFLIIQKDRLEREIELKKKLS